MEQPDPQEFVTHFADIRNGVNLAYVHEGIGGYPLLLIHGYPETKRIWWRNIGVLAAAGFEVIVPDLRGHGDSSLAPDGFYDIAAFSKDCYTLVHDVLGHARCAVAAGDVGALVLYDLGLRYNGWVERQVFFNTLAPPLDALYETHGIAKDPPHETRPSADYFVRQSTDPEGLLAELDTPQRRRAYVADMYGHRLWASPGSFSRADVQFHAEPYGDADKLRASWGVYEGATGRRPMEDIPCVLEPTPVPTLVLYGVDDQVVPTSFPAKAAVACSDCIGPLIIERAGHFLQWEQAHIFNQAVKFFLRDLVVTHHD
jgi:pimeloyl-ACP methyl ester carboxylesterase